VDTGANLEAEVSCSFDDPPRARDRPCGTVEPTEEPVTGGVD